MDSTGPAYRQVLVLGLLAGLLTVGVLHLARQPPPVSLRPVADTTTEALDVLRAWDDRREAAYVDGDVRALRALYLPASSAGTADVRLLRGYRDRRVRVIWLRTQIFSVQVLERRPDELRLRVVDRIAGGSVLTASRCQRFPTDRARARSIELRRVGDEWKVASVRL